MFSCANENHRKVHKNSKKETADLTIGVMPITDCLPFYVAGYSRIFEKEGVKVKLITYKSSLECGAAIRQAKIDGAYRFGIYTEANPTGKPLQTVTITYANSTVTPESGTAKFTNLTLGGTYYIYELDDNDVPIRGDNTLATVNGANFLVTYSNGPAVTIPESGTAAAAVTVTNQVCYPELPHTGGAGTTLYTKGGVLLTASAMFLLLYYHTKRRKEESASS